MFPDKIRNQLSFLGEELIEEIEAESKLMEVPSGTELLHEGQYVKVIPLVLDGLIRVYITDRDKEMLLYYIQPKESSSCLSQRVLIILPPGLTLFVQKIQ